MLHISSPTIFLSLPVFLSFPVSLAVDGVALVIATVFANDVIGDWFILSVSRPHSLPNLPGFPPKLPVGTLGGRGGEGGSFLSVAG